MAHEIRMPRLGWTMEEGVFGEWLKADGDLVAAGDLLYTVEGDKAIQEVEALESGILRLGPHAPQAGAVVPVGAVMAYLLAEGEAGPLVGAAFEGAGAAGAAGSVAAADDGRALGGRGPAEARGAAGAVVTSVDAVAEPVGAVASPATSPAASPRARRVAAELNVVWQQLQGSGRTGRIVERDVRAAAQLGGAARVEVVLGATQDVAQSGVMGVAEGVVQSAAEGVGEAPLRATPLAQRVAREAGIDLATVGPPANGGRIQRRDVEAAIRGQQDAGVSQAAGGAGQAQPAAAQHAAAQHTDERPAQGVVEPISRVRQLIAQRMMEGAHGTAPVTLTTEADATALAELRSHLRTVLEARGRRAPSYNDLLIKLTAVALREHPQLNATWQGETIQRWERIDIGLAVDTADGLLVPVVRDAGRRSVGQIAEVTADLVQRAGARQLTVDELRGGTFTITNLGMYQIDAFTPIINLPQCAILGVGRIQARPAVVDGQVVPRRLVFLSLTFDHRVVDGAPAARFLNTVREFVEEPALWTMA